MASIKDIASATGYSLSTVSIVLRGLGYERGIPDSTQGKIFDVARSMGYQPNVYARRLRSDVRHKRTIAVFWASDFRTSMFAKFLQGLQSYVSDTDSDLEFVMCPFDPGLLSASFSPESFYMYMGAIVCTASESDIRYVESLNLFSPIVFYNRYSLKYSSANVDNEKIGMDAAKKLIDDGCEHLYFVSDHGIFSYREKRRSGFVSECSKNSIVPEILYAYGSSISDGFSVASEIDINSGKAGVFISPDYLGMGLLTVLVERGIDIPAQVEILSTGTSDNDIYKCLRPSLSTISIPIGKMAYKCAELIEAELSGKSHGIERVMVEHSLALGGSTL